jgi:hypothetical protein
VKPAPAAGTGLVLDVDHLLDARQMGGQRAAVGAAPADTGLTSDGVGGVLAGEARRLDLLDLLQP